MTLVFGEFVFDLASRELTRNGRPVPLQPQPARVLQYLIEHRGRMVERQDVIRHVWPDGHHVNFDQGLNYCIRQVRVALGDTAAAPRYLETVPRRGYRWIAAVAGPSTLPLPEPAVPWRPGALFRPVPLWGALASGALGSLMTASMFAWAALHPVRPSDPVAATSPHYLVRDALHTLAHVAVDPGRVGEAPRAIATLWEVTASHVGLSHDGRR